VKSRVLFVDDEHNILDGLRRMFHDMRGEWDMAFAAGGREALAMMAQDPYDVVVSDMRMPGMGGAELLAEVRARYPQTVRIVLSGHSDQDMILRTVKPAHQFLHKPIQAEELKHLIRRATRLKNIFLDDAVKSVVSKIDSLPSAPRIYLELLGELAKDACSAKSVADLVARDVGMSAGILKLVNSAFFGQRERIASIAHAVNLLGTEIIKSLVIYLDFFTKFNKAAFPDFDLEMLWGHSLTTGLFARTIAASQGAPDGLRDDCHIAGLLHDVGKLVLAVNFERQYAEILARCRAENRTVWEMEKQALGTSHAEVGAYLLGLWGLSDQVVAAVLRHHEPSSAPAEGFSPLTAVHAANVLAHEQVVIHAGFASRFLDAAYLEAAGCLDNIDAWREACAAALSEEAPGGSENPVR
jgi:HD-like signal output (HDOD) protein